jgi:carbon-monoxide dehydrogenase large subunit
MCYDAGDYARSLDAAMKAADYAGFEKRRAEAKKRGKLRGIGMSNYIEACGIAPSAAVGRSAPASASGNRLRCGSTRSARSRC